MCRGTGDDVLVDTEQTSLKRKSSDSERASRHDTCAIKPDAAATATATGTATAAGSDATALSDRQNHSIASLAAASPFSASTD